MKYLIRFNEELKSQTYLRAAYRLKKIGNKSSIERSNRLKDWAGVTELREYKDRWRENIEKYSKYGKIIGSVNGEKINFYYNISFDSFAFTDTFESDRDENGNIDSHIGLSLWLTPLTEEEVDKCIELSPSSYDYFSNGEFQSHYISIDFKVNNDELTFTNLNLYLEEEVAINLTPNAGLKIKETLIKLFSDKSLNYPSSVDNYDTEYEHIESTLAIECSMSVDFGFEMKQVADYIETIPRQKFVV